MSTTIDTTEADRALKARHRAVWALGDYPTVAAEVIPNLGAVLVETCGVGPGMRVLDIAAGPGNVAIPAALAGARVVASDLTPELLDAGRREAARVGAELEWHEADAEALPFGDNEFDIVLSCVGIMFAPHHRASADELVRVCKPGGRIGLISWTPGGFVGQMLAAMKPYMPPPPPGASPAPLWGDENHVTNLLGERVGDVSAQKQTVHIDRFSDPVEFRDYFKTKYGPTVAVYQGIADDREQVAALDADLVDLARRYGHGTTTKTMDWEYLLFTATKRA